MISLPSCTRYHSRDGVLDDNRLCWLNLAAGARPHAPNRTSPKIRTVFRAVERMRHSLAILVRRCVDLPMPVADRPGSSPAWRSRFLTLQYSSSK